MTTAPFRPLARPLSHTQRAELEGALQRLLGWQRSLTAWALAARAPDATPFVSLYARGRLVGCFGCSEGPPSHRLARAFLRALEDTRFGGIATAERASLSAEVAYPLAPRTVAADRALARIRAGIDGLALASPAVVLLPAVARDTGLDARGLVAALCEKARIDSLDGQRLLLFEVESVSAHARAVSHRARAGRQVASSEGDTTARVDAAGAWLARRVHADGAIDFAVDGRARRPHGLGPMASGRAAVALRALDAWGGATSVAPRLRRALAAQIRDALSGRPPEGWPDRPDAALGTVALGCLAGLGFERELAALARSHSPVTSAWYAAQACLALGTDAPPALWRACVADLVARPWAPWTAWAARARGDAATVARCTGVLVRSVDDQGGVDVTPVPEIALTALVVEALGPLRQPAARRACRRARAFLKRWQWTSRVPGALEPELVAGAWPVSPILPLARVDVTAHALLALRSAGGIAR